MSKYFELALRLVSLGWLGYHLCAHFPELVAPLPAAGLLAAGWAAGELAAARLPAPAGLVLLALLPAAAHRLAVAAAELLRGAAVRGLPVLMDQYAWVLAPAVALTAVSSLAWRRWRLFRWLEPALHGLLLAGLFWNQANHRLSLYAHPAPLAAAVLLFLLVNAARTALARPRIEVSARRRAGGRLKAAALALVVLVLPLGLVLHSAYRRYAESSTAAGGGLIKPGLLRFDFSDYVRLESEIRVNKDLVMLVKKNGFPDKYLLRRFVLAGYRGGGFFQDRDEPLAPAVEQVPERAVSITPSETYGREPVEQEVYLVNLEPDALVSINYPVEIAPLKNWRASSFTRVYRAVALANVLLPFEFERTQGPALSEAELGYYTRGDGGPRIRRLAEQLTDGLVGLYDKVQAINLHLSTAFNYSLRPGVALDGDQLSHFLFVSRKGYCSYFAFAMALMCRSIGIPARVAVGFFINPESETLGYHPVKADMAHAWVEVYFGRHGWIEFDPTSRIPAAGENFETDAGGDASRYSGLVEEILRNRGLLDRDEVPAGPASLAEGRRREGSGLPAPGLAAAAGLILALALYGRLRWGALAAFLPGRDGRRRTAARLELVFRGLAGAGFSRRRGESRPRYAARLKAETGLPVDELFSLYQAARFAPDFPAEADRRAAAAHAELRRQAHRRLGLPRRLRWLVHPAGLRGSVMHA